MKVLVLGSKGQLGRCLQDQLIKTNYEVIYASRKEIDLSNLDVLKNKIILISPDVIINAAAFTAVDRAEVHPKEANLINNLAVRAIADICNELGCWVIHISTDYVFDGTTKTPYQENDKVNPRCIYGKSKLKGEEALKSSGCKFIIIRTAWVYSEYGDNFLKTMLQLSKDRDELSVVGDQIGCPTNAKDVAKCIISILPSIYSNKIDSDIIHFCGDYSCSWYDFAVAIFIEAESLGLMAPKKVNSVETSDYPTLAARPKFSVLDCSKIKNVYGITPSNWRNEIKNVIKKVNNFND